jgi:hypothetical protein
MSAAEHHPAEGEVIARYVLRCSSGSLYRATKVYANQLFNRILMPVS